MASSMERVYTASSFSFNFTAVSNVAIISSLVLNFSGTISKILQLVFTASRYISSLIYFLGIYSIQLGLFSKAFKQISLFLFLSLIYLKLFPSVMINFIAVLSSMYSLGKYLIHSPFDLIASKQNFLVLILLGTNLIAKESCSTAAKHNSVVKNSSGTSFKLNGLTFTASKHISYVLIFLGILLKLIFLSLILFMYSSVDSIKCFLLSTNSKLINSPPIY